MASKIHSLESYRDGAKKFGSVKKYKEFLREADSILDDYEQRMISYTQYEGRTRNLFNNYFDDREF